MLHSLEGLHSLESPPPSPILIPTISNPDLVYTVPGDPWSFAAGDPMAREEEGGSLLSLWDLGFSIPTVEIYQVKGEHLWKVSILTN